MIRARLTNGDLATFIGSDPNGGYVIRTDKGDFQTVDQFTPEFGTIRPQPITGVYQGDTDYGIASWPTPAKAQEYAAGQLNSYGRIIPFGQIMHHNGLIILADSTGQPLRSDG